MELVKSTRFAVRLFIFVWARSSIWDLVQPYWRFDVEKAWNDIKPIYISTNILQSNLQSHLSFTYKHWTSSDLHLEINFVNDERCCFAMVTLFISMGHEFCAR